ncbi:MAG: AMP-binding protein [Alphaproteobacteria bacterium]|nr:AMP-binding protein [Alphaproteobacteria bacterium]
MACDDAIDLFLARAAAAPAQAAVVTEAGAVSYGRLAALAARLAAAFARVAEPRVLIALPAGAAACAAMIAAGLAGGYYVPVNIDSPPLKLRRIARLLEPDIIVADTALGAALREEAPAARLIEPAALADGAQPAPPLQRPRPRHPVAYVMFTSGSTGDPKGVVIPRAALDHYVGWMQRSRIFGAADRVSQYASIGFDFSVMEIYGALCAGAALFPVLGQGSRLFPAAMIAAEKITVWNSVPSVVSLMMRAGGVTAGNLSSLRLMNFCGEPLLPQHLDAIFAACPGITVQNTYGPTEATVSMTSLLLRAGDYRRFCRSSVALGEAIPGMGLHLVGGAHPDEGEIVITGPQLASGYWRDPERTAQLFRAAPLASGSVTGYFTGDWAERHGGQVFFKERIDFQVKVKGVRIELDEVEAALRELGWPVVCVIERRGELVALIERAPGTQPAPPPLREALAARLEAAAIPKTIRFVDRMPRNDNGKIDRRAVAAWLAADGPAP